MQRLSVQSFPVLTVVPPVIRSLKCLRMLSEVLRIGNHVLKDQAIWQETIGRVIIVWFFTIRNGGKKCFGRAPEAFLLRETAELLLITCARLYGPCFISARAMISAGDLEFLDNW